MIDIKRALSLAVNQLNSYSNSARIDAEVLLAYVLTVTRTYLHTHSETSITKAQLKHFEHLITRRSLGMPVAYLTGMREFWSLPLKVSEETLIPRPETELLVSLSLTLRQDYQHASVLDLGTGSGAVALALAKERPAWCITACDCSAGALEIAETNAKLLALTNISFCKSDWFEQLNPAMLFDAIVCNPPYIPANDPHLNQGDVRFEPKIALVSGDNGLTALEHIIASSLSWLTAQGLLLIEHGFDQKKAIATMLYDYGYSDIHCWQDLHGNDRVSTGHNAKQCKK